MMRQVDEIEAAFKRVRSSAMRVMGGDEASKDQSFHDIFDLNNEIGRLARDRPKTMPKMKELQSYVNMITVGMKYDRMGDLREGLAVTEKSIKALKKDFDSAP